MLILIPFPTLAPHGGTRVAVEIANRLADRGHDIRFCVLKPGGSMNYWDWHPNVKFINHTYSVKPDRVLITSPHSIYAAVHNRTVIHLQMLEHMFQPHSIAWQRACLTTYMHPAPMLSISAWNRRELMVTYGRKEANTGYIGNGVNTDHFPWRGDGKRELKTVLVEGWVAHNPCKDVDRVGPKAVARLRADGYHVIAYGQLPPTEDSGFVDEFYLSPDLETLNTLYERATILVKASKHDARSCSPVEAMAKGCVTTRAIVEGDDDLVDQHNCLRVDYDGFALYEAAKTLLEDADLRAYLRDNGLDHIGKHCDWTRWINVIEKALIEVRV